MGRRFPPRVPEQDAATQARQAFGGSLAGRARNAAPVSKVERVAVQASVTQTGADSFWAEDHFSVDEATAPGTFTLTYLPRANSEDVKVNGVGLLRGSEWTRSGQVVTVPASVWAGLGAGNDLTIQYEVSGVVMAAAARSASAFRYVVPATNASPMTIPTAVLTDDVCLMVTTGNVTALSGAWATWTLLYDQAGSNSETLRIWKGVGVGTGSTVTATVSAGQVFMAAAVYETTGTVSLVASTSFEAFVSGSGSISSPVAAAAITTAAAGQIVLAAAKCGDVSFSSCYPDGTHTDTGFSGGGFTYDNVGYGEGLALATGIASAATVGGSFGVTIANPAYGNLAAVNLLLEATP